MSRVRVVIRPATGSVTNALEYTILTKIELNPGLELTLVLRECFRRCNQSE